MTLALIIFALTYLVLIVGELPGFRVYRTSAAFIGAVCMVAFGELPTDQLLAAIDFPTLVLLFAMMIVAASLRLCGAFRLLADAVLRRASGPYQLLLAVIALSGVLSACFVNDVVCVVLTPLVLEIARALRRNPVPYLIALAVAANIGSTATIIGNPQNMIIGSLSGISYRSFVTALGLPALIGLVIAFGLVGLLFRRELKATEGVAPEVRRFRVHRWLVWKNSSITVLLLIGFIAGLPVATTAAAAAAWILFTRRVHPAKVFALIDWELLVMFAGLFVVVAGLEHAGLDAWLHQKLATTPALLSDGWFALASVGLSNIVSNVPAVLLLKQAIPAFADRTHAWLVLALTSTLAGNLTIPGSVANLIVVESARRHGVKIGALTYLRVGVPLTAVTIVVGMLLLQTIE